MNLVEKFPNISEKTTLWEERVVTLGFYTKEEAQQIISNFYDIGPPFVSEAFKKKAENKIKIKISNFTPESFFKIISKKHKAKSPITFTRHDGKNEVVLRGIQGTIVGWKNYDIEKPPQMILFLEELVELAREGGYTTIKLSRPEQTTHYVESEEVLKELWCRKYPDEASIRNPTVFELHEIELEHQDRMRALYYTITRKAGFKKKEAFFEFKLKHKTRVINSSIYQI